MTILALNVELYCLGSRFEVKLELVATLAVRPDD
jgi:hypothetical protein